MPAILCRVCINPFQESEMRKLFDEMNVPLALAAILAQIGDIKVNPADTGMPRLCCKRCSSRLEEANDLRKLCQESDEKLRKMISREPELKIQDHEMLTEQDTKHEELPEVETIKVEELHFSSDDNPNPNDGDSDYEEEMRKPKKPTKQNCTKSKTKNPTGNNSKPQKERKTYQCSICGRMAPNNQALRVHEANHRPDRPLKCHICPKSFVRRTTLQRHIETHGPKQGGIKCDQCDKVLHDKRSLKEHIDSRHTGDRPYKCELCPKSYPRRTGLYAHVQQVHYKIKRFQCKLCPKAFTSSFILNLHVTSIHERVKICPCPHCNKKYTTKSYLQQHLAEKHPETLENVNRCAFCGLGYNQKGHYRKHIVQRHPERLEELEEFFKQP